MSRAADGPLRQHAAGILLALVLQQSCVSPSSGPCVSAFSAWPGRRAAEHRTMRRAGKRGGGEGAYRSTSARGKMGSDSINSTTAPRSMRLASQVPNRDMRTRAGHADDQEGKRRIGAPMAGSPSMGPGCGGDGGGGPGGGGGGSGGNGGGRPGRCGQAGPSGDHTLDGGLVARARGEAQKIHAGEHSVTSNNVDGGRKMRPSAWLFLFFALPAALLRRPGQARVPRTGLWVVGVPAGCMALAVPGSVPPCLPP